MRVTREQADATRERIVDTAARLFRGNGFDGIGVADLMKGAGLTHGGFYAHFGSKEDLMADACRHALGQSLAAWRAQIDKDPGHPLRAVTRAYLSSRHRDHPQAASACMIAAGGTDIARLGRPVRQAATAGIEAQLDLLADLLPGRTGKQRRQRALVAYSSLLGALLLSRVVADPGLSDAILAAVGESLA